MSTSLTWETVANIPWWVYVLFFYFIQVGIVASKPSTISLKKLFILPFIFFGISVLMMVTLTFHFYYFLIWLSSIFVGTLLGWIQFYFLKIKPLKNENMIYVPGTRILFILPFVFCAFQYYSAWFDPTQLLNAEYVSLLYAFYGICLGFCLGRLFYSRWLLNSI